MAYFMDIKGSLIMTMKILKNNAKYSAGQIDLALMRRIADRLVTGITTGEDWPNSADELLRLQAAQLLRMAADDLDAIL